MSNIELTDQRSSLLATQHLNVLITGGLGFIGSNLALRCLEMDWNVTILDNLDPNSGGNIFNIDSFKDSVELIDGDVTDYVCVLRNMAEKDIVFNCAASTSHSYSMKDPWANLDINSKGVINILESIRQVSPKAKFIHLGTTTQFGTLQNLPADESHPEFPLDMYSANKVAAEKYVHVYSKAYNLASLTLRISNVYGPRAAIHTSSLTFNNYFIGLALQDKPIVVFGSGDQLRNLLYIDDVVDAVVSAALIETISHPVLLVVGSNHYSVLEIAETISTRLGGDVSFGEWPPNNKIIEIGDAVFSNKLAGKVLGWEPKIDFITGLDLTKKYYDQHLVKYLDL